MGTVVGLGSHTILVILASVPCLRQNPVQDTEDRALVLELYWDKFNSLVRF